MQNSFDDILSNKFKEAFDAHEEAFEEQDWDLMKAKLSNKKKAFVLFTPLLAKAASVLLIIGLTAFVTYKLSLFSFQKKYNLAETRELLDTPENNILTEEPSFSNNNSKPEKDLNKESHLPAYLHTESNSNNEKQVQVAKTEKSEQTISSEKESTGINNSSNYLTISRKEISAIAFVIDTFSRKALINKINDELIAANNELLLKEEKHRKKFNFSANVSSFYNYSESQKSSNANMGAGFLSEYKITKNIGIHSGVLFSKNSLDSDLHSSGLFASSNDYEAAPEASAGFDEKEEVYSFVSIDIPINIYFYHKNMFFSTGLSSIAYFNEQTQRTYQEVSREAVYNSATNTFDEMNIYSTVTENETSGNIKTFNLGRMLNLSAGYKFNRKKRNIILEPYAKIPLGELTSKNIYYGHAGISLRYQF